MRELKSDGAGLAAWIERSSEGMDPLQVWRELVVNGIEAGANQVIIGPWTDPDTGRLLAKCQDNGQGMTPDQLIRHLSTIHVQTGKGSGNYGVGARIASLSANKAGVMFASRTASGSSGLVNLIKKGNRYGIQEWPVLDADGYEVPTEVVEPSDGELDGISKDHGTSVILRGSGTGATWGPSKSYEVHQFLGQRFFRFPGNAKVSVFDEKGHGPRGQNRAVRPVGELLAQRSLANGEIPFKNVAGLNGVMLWWVLPPNLIGKMSGREILNGGVGLTHEDEIFNYDKSYSADFGLIYKQVVSRVVVLVRPHGVKMDTERAALVFPSKKTNRKNVPWKALGAYFSDNMPSEIDVLLSGVTASSTSINALQAKMLDAEWRRKLLPTRLPVSTSDGDQTTGHDDGTSGLGTDKDDHFTHKRPSPNPDPRPRAKRSAAGNNPATGKPRVDIPKVEFVECENFLADSYKSGIVWVENINTLLISKGFPPYVREVDRFIESTSHTRSVVEGVVQGAYMVEYSAHIIDANGQDKHNASPEMIEGLKSEATLAGKPLGMQSWTAMIEKLLKNAGKTI